MSGYRATVGNELCITGYKFGNLLVGTIAGRNPTRYNVKCSICGSSWVSPATLLQNDSRCQNGVCRRQTEDADRAQRFGTQAPNPLDLDIDPRTFDLYKEMQAQRDEQNKGRK